MFPIISLWGFSFQVLLVLVGFSGLVLFGCAEFVRSVLFVCFLSYSSFSSLKFVFPFFLLYGCYWLVVCGFSFFFVVPFDLVS